MQREYLETMAKITAWRANKKGLPQPALRYLAEER